MQQGSISTIRALISFLQRRTFGIKEVNSLAQGPTVRDSRATDSRAHVLILPQARPEAEPFGVHFKALPSFIPLSSQR